MCEYDFYENDDAWLRVRIRNQAAGGSGEEEADDGMGPLDSVSNDDGMCGGSRHCNC